MKRLMIGLVIGIFVVAALYAADTPKRNAVTLEVMSPRGIIPPPPFNAPLTTGQGIRWQENWHLLDWQGRRRQFLGWSRGTAKSQIPHRGNQALQGSV